MRLVVLGASGQLGSRVLQQLRQDYPGDQVLGTVRVPARATAPGGAPPKELLLFDPFGDDWARLGRVDVLINCIGIIRETPALDFTRAHLGLTSLMLQHRVMLGNPRIIQVSALGADVASSSAFLRTKGLADVQLLRQPGTVVLRPSIVCTPDTMLSRKLQLLGNICRFTAGLLLFPAQSLQTKIQPVAAADLTALVSQLCCHSFTGVVALGGKETYSLKQLLRLLPTCRKILPVSQAWCNHLMPLLAQVFAALPDKEQQLLLQQDNVTDTAICEQILGRPMASTQAYWQEALA